MLADRINPKVAVSIVFVLGLFMAIMDITIVNVALPTLGRDFHVSPDRVESIVVGFLVSLAVFIPASGWLGDRYGTKRVFLAALLIFTGASALCGTAQSLNQLVIYRILQGVGGGMLTPVGMAMLMRTFPPAERIRASRILFTPTALAPALGPVLGGLLVTDASWRWVFFVNLPIGAGAFIFGLLFLHENKQDNPGRFDVPGFLLAGAGFASLMYAVSEGPSHGWSSGLIIGTGLLGVALLAALIRVELSSRQPMIDLRLWQSRLFSTTTMVVFFGTAGFLGTLFVVALFFQDGLGLDALGSGLNTFPEAVGVMIGAQSATRLYPHIGPRRITAVGLVGVAASISLLATVGLGTSLWVIRAFMLLLGICMAHVFVPSQAAAFATISPAASGRASTMFNAARQLGSAVGVAVLSTVISAVGVVHLVNGQTKPHLAAYHIAFLAAAGLALGSALIALRIDDKDAAPTMKPKDAPPATTTSDRHHNEPAASVS